MIVVNGSFLYWKTHLNKFFPERLNLRATGLTGTLDASIGRFTSLSTYDKRRVSCCRFQHISCSWSSHNLVSEILQLQLNELSGTLSSDFRQLTKLETLYISDNKFEGDINDALMGMDSLVNIVARNNNLGGRLGAHILNRTNVGKSRQALTRFLDLLCLTVICFLLYSGSSSRRKFWVIGDCANRNC